MSCAGSGAGPRVNPRTEAPLPAASGSRRRRSPLSPRPSCIHPARPPAPARCAISRAYRHTDACNAMAPPPCPQPRPRKRHAPYALSGEDQKRLLWHRLRVLVSGPRRPANWFGGSAPVPPALSLLQPRSSRQPRPLPHSRSRAVLVRRFHAGRCSGTPRHEAVLSKRLMPASAPPPCSSTHRRLSASPPPPLAASGAASTLSPCLSLFPVCLSRSPLCRSPPPFAPPRASSRRLARRLRRRPRRPRSAPSRRPRRAGSGRACRPRRRAGGGRPPRSAS